MYWSIKKLVFCAKPESMLHNVNVSVHNGTEVMEIGSDVFDSNNFQQNKNTHTVSIMTWTAIVNSCYDLFWLTCEAQHLLANT